METRQNKQNGKNKRQRIIEDDDTVNTRGIFILDINNNYHLITWSGEESTIIDAIKTSRPDIFTEDFCDGLLKVYTSCSPQSLLIMPNFACHDLQLIPCARKECLRITPVYDSSDDEDEGEDSGLFETEAQES